MLHIIMYIKELIYYLIDTFEMRFILIKTNLATSIKTFILYKEKKSGTNNFI